MKNKKYAKILVLALSLALLIGAAVGIAASAEGAPEVLKKNIEYGETLKFMVAVDPESVGGADKTVTLSVFEGDPEDGGKLVGQPAVAVYQDTSTTNIGVDAAYIATSTYGVSALAYGQEYYLVVECDGATTTEKYSAVEYFLKRLYGDDIINATEELGIAQKALYQNAIAYGSSAQTVAKLEDPDLDTGTNVGDYCYVGATGGEVLVDGASVGSYAILTKGEIFSLTPATALAAGNVALWKDAAGNSYRGAQTITVAANAVYSYTALPMLTFEGMNDVIPTVKTNTSTTTASQVFTTFGDDYAAYNRVFKLYTGALEKNMPTASIVDEKLVVNSDDGSDYIKIYPTYTETGYNHTTFEADITFNCNTGNIGFDLLASDNSTAVRFQYFTYNMSTGYFKMNATNTSGGTGNTIEAYLDTTGDNAHTLNLKVDHYKFESDILVAFWLNGTLSYIIDSRLATDATTGNIDSKNTDGVYLSGTRYYPCNFNAAGKEAAKTDFSQFSLNTNSNFSGSISFDNIIFTQTVTNEEPTYNTNLK